MELCKKQKSLSQLSAESLKFTFKFHNFDSNDESHGVCFSEIIDRQCRRYFND